MTGVAGRIIIWVDCICLNCSRAQPLDLPRRQAILDIYYRGWAREHVTCLNYVGDMIAISQSRTRRYHRSVMQVGELSQHCAKRNVWFETEQYLMFHTTLS